MPFSTFKTFSAGIGLTSILLVTAIYYGSTTKSEASPSNLSSANNAPIVEFSEDVEDTPTIKVASLSTSTIPAATALISDNQQIDLDPPRLNTDESLRLATKLSKTQNFNEALRILDNIRDEDQNDYAVRFLEARILAWSGQHYTADQKFLSLRADYPKDADIKVSFGYLKYYQSNFAQAEQIFSDVLVNHPDYQDASDGLKRVRATQSQ